MSVTVRDAGPDEADVVLRIMRLAEALSTAMTPAP